MLHVVVVESHQHALEHLHHVLRKRRLAPWSLIHLDAHPDLACPGPHIPARACFQPRQRFQALTAEKEQLERCEEEDVDDAESGNDLYDFLDGTVSGIAEWILPLVFAANLQHIHWIRPRNTRDCQFGLGTHQFNVGAWSPTPASVECQRFWDLPGDSVLKTDYACPYYDDDGSVAPTNELILPKTVHLTVAENIVASKEDTCDEWVLDICLDYFLCQNPFWSDLEAINIKYANLLRQAIETCPLHREYANTDTQILRAFHESLHALFESLTRLDSSNSYFLIEPLIHPLFKFYPDSESQTLDLWQPVLESVAKQNQTERNLVMKASLELVPNLAMPHNQPRSSFDEDCKGLLVQFPPPRLWDDLRAQLERCKADLGQPLVVTIARSANDGFTPTQHVESLQSSTIELLHKVYCGCFEPLKGECSVCVTQDYGDWEGSTLDL